MPFDLKQFQSRLTDATEYLEPLHKEMREDFRFYALQQWSKEDLSRLEEQLRPALVLDRIRPIVDAVSGTEIINRHEPKYFPRSPQSEEIDSQLSEMMSQVYRYSRQKSHAEQEESVAFRDAVICGVGCTETYQDYSENPQGVTLKDRLPIFDIAWDPTSTKQNLLDARWVIRGRWIADFEFVEQFGQEAYDSVRGISSDRTGGLFSTRMGKDSDATRAWMYRGEGSFYDPRKGRILVFDYQWWELVRKYRIIFGGQSIVVDQDEFPETLERIRGEILEQTGRPEPVDYFEESVREHYQAFVAGPILLEDGLSPVNDFTYKFITGFEDLSEEGLTKWFGVVRPMRGPQQLVNKLFSSAVHAFSSNPKGALVYEEGTFKNPHEASMNWNKAEGLIEVRHGGMDSFQHIRGPGLPSGIEYLVNFASSAQPLAAGVNESYFVGQAGDLRRTAASAVSSIQQQGITVLSVLFDSLRRYRKEDGVLMLKFIREFMPDEQVMRIVGPDGQDVIRFSKDVAAHEYDIIVDEAPSSINKRRETFERLAAHGALNYILESGILMLVPDFADYIFPDLPNDLRVKLKQTLLQMRQQQEGQQQPQQPQPEGETIQ